MPSRLIEAAHRAQGVLVARRPQQLNGTYPDDVEVQVGSRIKLWAHNTHADIGFAYAHPSMDGHPRFAHPQ